MSYLVDLFAFDGLAEMPGNERRLYKHCVSIIV